MMKLPQMILAHFLALIFAGQVHLHSVNIYPERATGIVGGEVQINCDVEFGPNNEMNWDFNNAFVYIIAGGGENYPRGATKYFVQRTGMNFALTVKDLKLKDGGEYRCTSFTSEATAFLVVLDTPSITLHPLASLEGEKVMVTCEASFGGPRKDLILPDHFPNLKLHLNGSSPKEMLTEKTTNKEHCFTISMTQNLTVHASSNNRQIKCEMGTAEPLMKRSSVAVINVLYSVRDIHITPDQEKYTVGDNISCIADSNPAPDYEWKEVQGGSTIYEKWLRINDTMIGENKWECVARNMINGEMFQESLQESFLVVDPSINGNGSSAVTIGVVAVVIVIIILVIIAVAAFFLRKKLRKLKGSRTNGNANNLQETVPPEAVNLLPTIQQEKDGSSAPEHSIAVNANQNIPQRNDGSGLSTNSIKPTIQQENDGSSAPERSIAKNIPQGRDGPGASEHTTLVTNKEQQSDVKKLLQQNIPQANDGSGPSKHSFKDEKTKAPKLGSLECIELLNTVKENQELDQKGKKILRTLKENRKSILEKDPNILIALIKKADKLIDSEYYEDIIKVAPHGGEDSPLKSLLDILNSDEGRLKILLKNQNKLLSVIKIISSHGDVKYRTECLRDIIVTKTFSGNKYTFEWSEEYLSTVKDLLENGADPTWIHPEDLKKERIYRSTAQNEFFGEIFVNLWEKNDLHESLLQVLPLMLSWKCKDNELLWGNLLHLFVYPRWDYIATNRELMPPDFFRQFQNILREILIHDGTLLVQKDWFGRTPLQYFLINIKLEESIFGEVREIIQMLRTPQVLSSQDDNGLNALHYLAHHFPVIRGEVSQSGRESFLELVESFANESNVGCQNEIGLTALHRLAWKFPDGISEESREVYQDFVKHLATYDILEIKDKWNGFTALHYLALLFKFEIEEWKMETFVEVLKCLAVPRTIFIKDIFGNTALEIISNNWGNEVPEHYKDKFKEISDILSGNN